MFNLGPLVEGDTLPTERVLRQRIARFPDGLPDGLSATYLAQFIAEELARGDGLTATVDSQLTKDDFAALAVIAPGKKAATAFHHHIFRILSGLFAGRLVDARKEVKQFAGRKRIDIRFRNADRFGFFFELERHEIKAPYVVVECKNYTSDPDNPEFDQLSGRLNPRVGLLGIMVVRSIADRARLDAHRLDRRAKGEWILVLDDQDVVTMLRAHLGGDQLAVDAVLRGKLEPLLFD
jgi:hypothetical protein